MQDVKKLLHNMMQLNLVTMDFDQTIKDLEELLGIGPFKVCMFPPEGMTHEEAKATYRGKPGNFIGKIGFFQMENIEFEVIEPIAGDNIWTDFLKSINARSGLHHIKFRLDGDSLNPAREHFSSKGIEEIMYGASVGANAGNEWTYFGTLKRLGFDVEVMTTKKNLQK